MFVDAALAARIDRVEARLSAAVAGVVDGALVTPIGGGLAVVARPGSPMTKVIGAGFDGALDPDALAAIEAAWNARGEAVRVELATLAPPEVAQTLTARGYRLLGAEHVLVRPLTDAAPAPALAITREHAAWRRIAVEGFATPDGSAASIDSHGRDALESVAADVAAAPGFDRYVALVDGAPAGAATLRLDDGVAVFCGTATLPAFRRRGVQAALLAARLADARRAGCDVAVVTTDPGSQSQRNVTRAGFAVGYARVVLVQPRPAAPAA